MVEKPEPEGSGRYESGFCGREVPTREAGTAAERATEFPPCVTGAIVVHFRCSAFTRAIVVYFRSYVPGAAIVVWNFRSYVTGAIFAKVEPLRVERFGCVAEEERLLRESGVPEEEERKSGVPEEEERKSGLPEEEERKSGVPEEEERFLESGFPEEEEREFGA